MATQTLTPTLAAVPLQATTSAISGPPEYLGVKWTPPAQESFLLQLYAGIFSSLFTGLVVGIVLAFFQHRIQDTAKEQEEFFDNLNAYADTRNRLPILVSPDRTRGHLTVKHLIPKQYRDLINQVDIPTLRAMGLRIKKKHPEICLLVDLHDKLIQVEHHARELEAKAQLFTVRLVAESFTSHGWELYHMAIVDSIGGHPIKPVRDAIPPVEEAVDAFNREAGLQDEAANLRQELAELESLYSKIEGLVKRQ